MRNDNEAMLSPADPAGNMTRRAFLAGSAAALTSAALGITDAACDTPPIEARYYEKLDGGDIRCLLCPRRCRVGDARRGACGIRENRGGTLHSLVYGRICALHLDPIEKKPFYHVLPGSKSLSLSTVGCNMDCRFCQNWQISQSSPEDVRVPYTSPERVVEQAVQSGASSIAYTYGEPVVFTEYMLDIAAIGRRRGVGSVVVSNGYIERRPLLDLCASVEAIKIDLKAFDDSYYGRICGARLKPVLDTIATIAAEGVWLEIVYLMVPTLNDDPHKIREMARWLVQNAGRDIPLHFSRFHPQYRLKNLPPTPIASLETAHDICRDEGLRYVYVGNVGGHSAESTYCPSCSNKIISRTGYMIEEIRMKDGICDFCGETIPGFWTEAGN